MIRIYLSLMIFILLLIACDPYYRYRPASEGYNIINQEEQICQKEINGIRVTSKTDKIVYPKVEISVYNASQNDIAYSLDQLSAYSPKLPMEIEYFTIDGKSADKVGLIDIPINDSVNLRFSVKPQKRQDDHDLKVHIGYFVTAQNDSIEFEDLYFLLNKE